MKISTLSVFCFCFFGVGCFSQLCAFKAIKSNKFKGFVRGVSRLKEKGKEKNFNQRNKNNQKKNSQDAAKKKVVSIKR